MKRFDSIADLRQYVRGAKLAGETIAFVPTMGALHGGHKSCIDIARRAGDRLVASIFVNPTQFGPNEDFGAYPRTLDADLGRCDEWGCHAVFVPGAPVMYPSEQVVWVDVERLTAPLCGRERPGHFRGVATVVTKLFNIVEPDVAVFGQKDAQQALVIRAVVEQLDMAVRLLLSPIVRDADGLALSSRNRYLSPDERRRAAEINAGLRRGLAMIDSGERDPARVCGFVRKHMEEKGMDRIDYVELLGAADLAELDRIEGRVILAVAAYVGSTRLIDNIVVAADKGGAVEVPLF